MSFIKIGSAQRDLSTADPQWIAQQIVGLKKDNLPVCVVVDLDETGVHVRFQTADCGGGGGGQWQPNRKEQAIFDLWKKCHVDERPVEPGNLVAFLQQVRRLL